MCDELMRRNDALCVNAVDQASYRMRGAKRMQVNDETVLVGMGLLYTVGATFDPYKGSQGTMSSRRSPSVAATAAARDDEAPRDECAPASAAEEEEQHNSVGRRPPRVKGLPLHMRRPYRVELVRTALKPSTANCLLRLAGLHRLPPGAVVVDPCAGATSAAIGVSHTPHFPGLPRLSYTLHTRTRRDCSLVTTEGLSVCVRGY